MIQIQNQNVVFFLPKNIKKRPVWAPKSLLKRQIVELPYRLSYKTTISLLLAGGYPTLGITVNKVDCVPIYVHMSLILQ